MLRLSLSLALIGLSACVCGAPPATTPEVCDNREDDDGDGLVDCLDPDCATDAACALGEGEGAAGEGEGAAAGEGEGAAGEGEGEGGGGDVCGDNVVGTTEDCDRANLDGASCVDFGFTGGTLGCHADCTFDESRCTSDPGEGEGEGAAGEGEGEGAAGEGEGEGAAGEGEGEGEGGGLPDEAGPVGDPLGVTLEFKETINLDPVTDNNDPTDDDTDCFRFTTTATSTITVVADDGGDHSKCGSVDVLGLDPQVELFDSQGNSLGIDDDISDDGTDFCAFLSQDEPAGTYIACVESSTADEQIGGVVAQIGVHVDISAVPTTPPPGDAGDENDPVPVALDFSEDLDIVDAAGATPDRDCYAFHVGGAGTLDLVTSDGLGGCPGDTQIELFSAGTTPARLAINDDIDFANDDLCSDMVVATSAGDFIACVTRSDFATDPTGDITGVVLDGTFTANVFPPLVIARVGDPVDDSGTVACSQNVTGNPGFDATVTTCNNRFVELYNPSDLDVVVVGGQVRRFSNGSATSQNINISNGATILGTNVQNDPNIQLALTYVIATKGPDFKTDFAFTPDQVSGGVSGNGNDVYALFLGGTGAAGVEQDVFGRVGECTTGVVGTDSGGNRCAGQDWEYTDGLAERDPAVVVPTTTFTIGQWTAKKNLTVGTFTTDFANVGVR